MTENILTDKPLGIDERKQIFSLNYEDIKRRIKAAAERRGSSIDDITLLAATKTIDSQVIDYAVKNGISVIGENRVQEFLKKEPELKYPVKKHFIGHLQSNKAKDIVGRVELIHSVDSVKLTKIISDLSLKKGIVTNILLEVNIAGEESKSGFEPKKIIPAMEEICTLSGIFVKGLMTIPPICENCAKNRRYFKEMYNLFLDIKDKKIDNSSMDILSMGMSDDFETAIEEGANLVRIGTALFGNRNYNLKP